MSNLLSYCGLTDARMRASEKDLHVIGKFSWPGRQGKGKGNNQPRIGK